jgi:hypothetical protein
LQKNMDAEAAAAAWRGAFEVKDWIVGFLETYAHYSMTLDMPLWATSARSEGTPFHKCSIKQLIELTVGNLKFIDKHRKGRTKWLNVVQAVDDDSLSAWWNAVKYFDCSGYALAGSAGAKGGVRNLLTSVLTMRDDGAFSEGHDWLHVLGVSTTQWTILLTAIQRALRAGVNPNIRVSYDSASPFQIGGMTEDAVLMPSFGSHPGDWAFGKEKAPQGRQYVGSDEPVGFDSPIGRILTKGHLNVIGNEWQSRKFDTVSNLLLINHNVWTYLAAFEEANRLAFETDRADVPKSWAECLDFIVDVFTVQDWRRALVNQRSLLNAVADSEY